MLLRPPKASTSSRARARLRGLFRLHRRSLVLAARGFQVELGDDEAEHSVVDGRVDRTEDEHVPGVLGLVSDQVEHQEIDAALGEGEAHVHVQGVGDELRRRRQAGMEEIQHRRHEQEGEFDGLGDAGEEGR
ncbi:hypothetical protein JOS77_05515 [Chromobacterium haemolyticum]|nr:hypothetical protein JOS77_05515 [Chromobacterium haemolyticum]